MSSAPVLKSNITKTGSDEIVIREPQYVFAVSDYLMATETDEVMMIVEKL